MIPAYKIIADNKDITAAIASRLISLEFEDNRGMDSDTVTLVLDDEGGGSVELPRKGMTLDVSLGYEGNQNDVGRFKVEEPVLNGWPATMKITARSVNLRKGLVSHKTRSWDQITLSALVAAIAAEHDMTPYVSESLGGELIEHDDQNGMSDLQYLAKLAFDRDAIAKPAGDKLLFLERGESKTVSGKLIPPVDIPASKLSTYNATLPDRDRYKRVVAQYQDLKKAKLVDVVAGEGDPSFTFRNVFPSKERAEKAAAAKLKAAKRNSGKLSIAGPGDNRILAETPLNVSGVREGVDGIWVVTTAKHTISKNAYVFNASAEKQS